MSLAGSLKTMHVGDLLQWCGTNLKTGTLRLTRGPIEKRLFFKEGQLFSSTSNSPRETLGQFLIRAGKINEMKSIEKTSVAINNPVPGNEPVSATIAVNRRFLDRYEQVVGLIQQDADAVREEILRLNQLDETIHGFSP